MAFVHAGEEPGFREAVFAWLRSRMLVTPVFARDDLAAAEIGGRTVRLIATQSGIWKPKGMVAALSFTTGYYVDDSSRPYADGIGPDELLRYKWRGTDPNHADNRALRAAMEMQVPLVWFVGVGHRPGTNTQVFQPVLPVWLIAEEPQQHQFVVALDAGQRELVSHGQLHVSEIERRYNLVTAKQRLHQPLFRTRVLHAYERRCAVCRLPFAELLDAAHIKSDREGGSAKVSNGLSLCRIHHGAYDANILGIDPDYTIVIKDSVLETFDGPTLQHALKEMHSSRLAQLPATRTERPDRGLLDERFQTFLRAS
jgi:putative restriction endonuclease